MSNLTFDEKLKKIIGMSHSDYLNGSENTDDCIDQIKQLISETIGEDEVKRDVPPNKNDSYESLNAQFKVMKYNQEKLPIVNELKKELRHAFNLKDN